MEAPATEVEGDFLLLVLLVEALVGGILLGCDGVWLYTCPDLRLEPRIELCSCGAVQQWSLGRLGSSEMKAPEDRYSLVELPQPPVATSTSGKGD